MRTAAWILALALTQHGAIAVAQTRECLDSGPRRSPSWVLLADASKQTICARQDALDRRREEERQREAYRKRWRDAANGAVVPFTVIPISAGPAGRAPQPRLSDDGTTLVLMEEVRAPANRLQPEITLGTAEATRSARIQVAGEGIAPLPAVAIACPWSRRSISLSGFSRESQRSVASYDVDESIARMVSSEPRCHVALAGAMFPIPRDLAAIVWPAGARK